MLIGSKVVLAFETIVRRDCECPPHKTDGGIGQNLEAPCFSTAPRMPSIAQSLPAEPDAAVRADGFRRVAHALQQLGHDAVPCWLDAAARTSQQAADALGVALGQIAKSVVFRRRDDDRAVLVIASGDRRVDEQRLAALVGPVGRADAQFVKSRTGFAIGGVSPVGLAGEPVLLLDRDLQRFAQIWAAAGHPHGVFSLTPQDLQRLTGAPWTDVVSG
jgi:prolyl-tRNA editing enzyme YbaK/EbsC (Cys-tRNA(Pro) deacylase)